MELERLLGFDKKQRKLSLNGGLGVTEDDATRPLPEVSRTRMLLAKIDEIRFNEITSEQFEENCFSLDFNGDDIRFCKQLGLFLALGRESEIAVDMYYKDGEESIQVTVDGKSANYSFMNGGKYISRRYFIDEEAVEDIGVDLSKEEILNDVESVIESVERKLKSINRSRSS